MSELLRGSGSAFSGFFESVLFSVIQMTDTDFFVRMFCYFDVQLESIALIDILRFFTILGIFCSR